MITLIMLFVVKYDKDFKLKLARKKRLPKEDGSFEYGYARWMTKKEIRKKFKVWNIGTKLSSGGIPVTYQNGKYYYSDSFDHTLIIGSTGSGKTQCEILPMIFNLGYAGESMVINDTKVELYNYTSDFLKKQKPKGSLSKMAYATGSFAKGETLATLFSVLATTIKMFSDTGIANLTSRTDFELDDIGKKKTAVFLIIPDEKESRHELALLFID